MKKGLDFVLMSGSTTLEIDIHIQDEGRPDSLNGYSARIGYFSIDEKCYSAVEMVSKRGFPYWKVYSSSRLNGIVCQNHQHNHSGTGGEK